LKGSPVPRDYLLDRKPLADYFTSLKEALSGDISYLKGNPAPKYSQQDISEDIPFFKISLFQEVPSWTGNPVPIYPRQEVCSPDIPSYTGGPVPRKSPFGQETLFYRDPQMFPLDPETLSLYIISH
jgi:hypothetical protein